MTRSLAARGGPLLGWGLLTLANVITVAAPVAAAWNDSHISKSRWPGHARFHGVTALAMATTLSSLNIWALWAGGGTGLRPGSSRRRSRWLTGRHLTPMCSVTVAGGVVSVRAGARPGACRSAQGQVSMEWRGGSQSQMICAGGLPRSGAGESASGHWPRRAMKLGWEAGRIQPCEPRA
jgi:hypothetical protein